MHVGVDIDDVLADFQNSFARFLNTHHGFSLTRDHFCTTYYSDILGCTFEQSLKYLDSYGDHPAFWEIQPLPGAVDGIKALTSRHTLTVVTARPLTRKAATLDFLDRHFGNPFQDVLFTNAINGKHTVSKAELCVQQGIDCLLEDNLEYALQCADREVKVLLMDAPWNRHQELPANISRIYSWEGAVAHLNRE